MVKLILYFGIEHKVSRMDMFLDYIPEGEAKINRDTRHNFKLFEYKRNTNSWSTDFVRFDWEKIYG